MHRLTLICFLLFFGACKSDVENTKEEQAATKAQGLPSEEDIAWIEGTWKIEGQKKVFEDWAKYSDTEWKGRSYEVYEGDTIVKERLHLIHQKDSIVYTAQVFNQNEGSPISFVMKDGNAAHLIFKNSNHDFPKEIQYRRANATSAYVFLIGDKTGIKQKLQKVTE